jgi:CNT family concentrative nucleoside transporter
MMPPSTPPADDGKTVDGTLGAHVPPAAPPPPDPALVALPPMPMQWRAGIGGGVLGLILVAYALSSAVSPRVASVCGVFAFFGLVAMFSSNIRAVNWKTIGWGIGLQALLAILVLKISFVHDLLEDAKNVVMAFINFSDKGADFVFGSLSHVNGPSGFVFAFKALPPILFVSAFFTVLYHYGVLQVIVRGFAKIMVHVMGTSGAETLSVSANVFMGQTEAPLIVKPYVPQMTNSELFVLMASGMAHISGGMMVVYIGYGADPVAVLTTCIMACPCSLYLSKLFMPEISTPVTAGTVEAKTEKSPYVNGIDAATAGTGDGLSLAMNVAAMLIVFVAFVAMFDGILGVLNDHVLHIQGGLTLQRVFGFIFSPAAVLMGVEGPDVQTVASLLGTKLAMNEHVAYLTMRGWLEDPGFAIAPRSQVLAAFALTGFANFASVGIQIGGIGAMAPSRRPDLARLGLKALFVGFTATMLNASIAGVLLSNDDKYETNNSIEQAASIASIESGQERVRLMWRDDDFFKLELPKAAASATVTIHFPTKDRDAELGQLSLALLSASGAELGKSEVAGPAETVTLPNLAAGTYVIRVTGKAAQGHEARIPYVLDMAVVGATPAAGAGTK